jgi:hypothetical protein
MKIFVKNPIAALAGAVTLCVAGSTAMADDYWPMSQYGIEVAVGGGVEGFTDDRMRDVTDPGLAWDVRAVIGTRSPIALEGAYTGSAKPIESIFGDQLDATLIGTGFEGALRVQLLPLEAFTPYAFGGLGWKRYDIAGEDFTTADTGIADEDTLLEIPVGAGLAYRNNGFVADARFTYRAAMGEDLVITNDALPDVDSDRGHAGLDSWAVAARVGFEF